MKLRYIYQSVLFIIGLFFILLGFVGLLLPIAPQVPFFIIGAICLMKSSNRIRDCVKQHALYKKHCQKFIEKSKLLKRILGQYSLFSISIKFFCNKEVGFFFLIRCQ